MYKIPLTSAPNQTLRCNIPVDGENKYFEFNLSYNSIGQYWMMTIRDGNTRQVIISNLNMFVTYGSINSNILNVYRYLRIGSAYVVPMIREHESAPNDTNLGTDYVLVWGDTV